MFKKLFSGQINSVGIAAILIGGSSMVSRFLGIFRDRILAGEFGAGDTMDVYYAAFRIPDLIFNLLVLGALSAGFIPIFTSLLKCEDNPCENREAWKFSNSVATILAAVLGGLSLAAMVFTPQLVSLIAPGFSGEKQAMTVELTRIMFLSPIFLGISSVFGGVLQSFKRFFVYSLSPIFYNIGIIIGALALVPIWGVRGLAWGVVLGSFLHMAVQMPLIIRLGFKYKFGFGWKHPEIRQLGRLMVPRTLTLATSQLSLVAITAIASKGESGSLAVFNFANNLQSFPVGIFGISYAVAVFPSLAACVGKPKMFVDFFSRTFRQIAFFIIPATVVILALRAQIVRVVLGTGQFGWHDTIRTIDTLTFFALSLFAQATLPLLVRMFYARQNSKTPFYVGLISVMIGIGLAFSLPQARLCQPAAAGQSSSGCAPMGVAGLALAFSLSSITNFLLLLAILWSQLGNLDSRRIAKSVIKITVASLAGGAAIQGMEFLVESAGLKNLDSFVDIALQMGISLLAGISIFIIACYAVRCEEGRDFWLSIKKRVPLKKVRVGDHGEARGI